MKRKQLTQSEAGILAVLQEYRDAHRGVPPTVREMASTYDCSTTWIHLLMQQLMAKGYIEHIGTGSRCYVPTRAPSKSEQP